ncbi:hypothetical protein SAMN05421774_1012 [Gemmobacter megaterium]|uniref:Lipoprotein n=1 Tax=Gemmobacter megaterium TaxID=1086013 RepID=A0A1N7JQJ6_9RHOB|nr:hypothetical protein [Gemmobacter megaterium]GGD98701.1 hypothetical protein GCM10011345_00010 [Gemmobacter megaterium]SIS51628.1 hypothetical protein SAMN05421774_1012 [Gemmobacter megaterium]
MTAFRLIALTAATLALAACETRTGLDAPPAELASFKLGHVAVVADKATKAPISRDAQPEQWKAALSKAVRDRFGRIDGDTFYHLGVHVDGYALAPPGVPLVISPKSVLIISVTLITDTEGGKVLNPKPEQLTVFETLSGGTVVGTGLTKTAEEQMENLSFNAALAIEDWLAKNPQFFDPDAKPIVTIPAASVK